MSALRQEMMDDLQSLMDRRVFAPRASARAPARSPANKLFLVLFKLAHRLIGAEEVSRAALVAPIQYCALRSPASSRPLRTLNHSLAGRLVIFTP